MTVGNPGAPFRFDGDRAVGVALFHGFTGTPWEIRYLGEQLNRAGHTVIAPLLAGHGTTIEDLDEKTWPEWTAAVDATIDELAAKCQRVAVVGQSLGGLLSLEAASRRPEIAAVASLAAPLWLDGVNGTIARWMAERSPAFVRALVKKLPKLGGSDVRDEAARHANPCYPGIPVKALGELLAFMRVVDEALPRVKQPTLVLHGTQDHTAPVACAKRIADRVGAVRTRIFPKSYHLLAVDVERDLVADEVIGFLAEHA